MVMSADALKKIQIQNNISQNEKVVDDIESQVIRQMKRENMDEKYLRMICNLAGLSFDNLVEKAKELN